MHRRASVLALVALGVCVLGAPAHAQLDNDCDDGGGAAARGRTLADKPCNKGKSARYGQDWVFASVTNTWTRSEVAETLADKGTTLACVDADAFVAGNVKTITFTCNVDRIEEAKGRGRARQLVRIEETNGHARTRQLVSKDPPKVHWHLEVRVNRWEAARRLQDATLTPSDDGTYTARIKGGGGNGDTLTLGKGVELTGDTLLCSSDCGRNTATGKEETGFEAPSCVLDTVVDLDAVGDAAYRVSFSNYALPLRTGAGAELDDAQYEALLDNDDVFFDICYGDEAALPGGTWARTYWETKGLTSQNGNAGDRALYHTLTQAAVHANSGGKAIAAGETGSKSDTADATEGDLIDITSVGPLGRGTMLYTPLPDNDDGVPSTVQCRVKDGGGDVCDGLDDDCDLVIHYDDHGNGGVGNGNGKGNGNGGAEIRKDITIETAPSSTAAVVRHATRDDLAELANRGTMKCVTQDAATGSSVAAPITITHGDTGSYIRDLVQMELQDADGNAMCHDGYEVTTCSDGSGWLDTSLGKNIRKSISVIACNRDGTEARRDCGDINEGTCECATVRFDQIGGLDGIAARFDQVGGLDGIGVAIDSTLDGSGARKPGGGNDIRIEIQTIRHRTSSSQACCTFTFNVDRIEEAKGRVLAGRGANLQVVGDDIADDFVCPVPPFKGEPGPGDPLDGIDLLQMSFEPVANSDNAADRVVDGGFVFYDIDLGDVYRVLENPGDKGDVGGAVHAQQAGVQNLDGRGDIEGGVRATSTAGGFSSAAVVACVSVAAVLLAVAAVVMARLGVVRRGRKDAAADMVYVIDPVVDGVADEA